jgi:uncharacterized protein (TIGR03086 family)
MSSGRSDGRKNMTTFVDLAPAADRVTGLLVAIPDDRLGAPTPCSEVTVGDLLSHLLGLSAAFRGGAEKAPDAGPPPTSGPPPLQPDWRTALPACLDALVAAWRAPAARAGTTSVGGVEMPAATAAVVALDELVLHGWDLARATGQPYEADSASVDACLRFVAATARPEGVPGLFGPPVPVPEDAPALHRLLGLSGRNPEWFPPNVL